MANPQNDILHAPTCDRLAMKRECGAPKRSRYRRRIALFVAAVVTLAPWVVGALAVFGPALFPFTWPSDWLQSAKNEAWEHRVLLYAMLPVTSLGLLVFCALLDE